MSLPDLHLTNIAKSFAGTTVLEDVTLTVPAGTTTALLGPSGCGKTTLLRIIAGLEHPDRGRIVLGSEELVGERRFVAPERRRLGMVFQDNALFPHLSVAANVAYGLSKEEVAAGRVDEALAMVEMQGLGDRRPDGLSGGQAQRVAVARALAPRPHMLLLDEPLSSLDADLRVRVRADLVRILRELQITAIFVTHDQEEAFVVGERIAVMDRGRILQEGGPASVYERPASAWIARFLGEANLLSGRVAPGGVTTPIGLIPTQSEPGPGDRVMVRPEYLGLIPGGPAVVSSVEFFGHDTSYEVAGFGEALRVRELQAPRFGVGDSVGVVYSGGPAVIISA